MYKTLLVQSRQLHVMLEHEQDPVQPVGKHGERSSLVANAATKNSAKRNSRGRQFTDGPFFHFRKGKNMSHLESGFCVTDIEALALTVKEQCPELQLVRQKTYRTWATDHGKLVGDYPLPGVYQVKLMAALKKQGVDVHAAAKAQGVTLPANLLDLLKKPWTLAEQKKLFQDDKFKKAYDKLSSEVVGNDAEFVIKYKDGKGRDDAYEIGLVPHPVNKGEYLMMTDFYAQGNGLLKSPGVGQHKPGAQGSDSWGGELKKSYAVKAAERTIQKEIKAGNSEFGSYKKVTLPDGRVKIEVTPKNGGMQ